MSRRRNRRAFRWLQRWNRERARRQEKERRGTWGGWQADQTAAPTWTKNRGGSDLDIIPTAEKVKPSLWDVQVTRQIPLYVEMPASVYAKIIGYCRAVDYEVSGLGSCSYDPKTGCVLVHDALLPRQTGGVAHTDLDQEAISQLMVERIKAGDRRALNFWWHSHVDMGCFWSGTDDGTSEKYGEGKDIFLSIVAIQAGNMRAKVHTRVETWNGYADQVPIHVRQEAIQPARIMAECRAEVAAKVNRAPEPITYYPSYGSDALPAYYRQPKHYHGGEWHSVDREGNIVPNPIPDPVAPKPYQDGEKWWIDGQPGGDFS